MKLLGRVAHAALLAGGALIGIAALVVSGDVLARKFFGLSLGGSDELSGYALAIGTSWSLAFVLLARGNVRVDALYQHLPRRFRALLDLLSLVALGVVGGLLARYGYEVFATSWALQSISNTPLKTPLWIPQGLWFAGLVLFAVTLVALTVRAAAAFVRGDIGAVQAMAGARSIQEDAEDEASYSRAVSAAGKDERP